MAARCFGTALMKSTPQLSFCAVWRADDCQRIFGAVRISKYVAQDNMEPITCGRRIHHRAIAHYFDSYSPAAGLYVPNRKLRFESLHPFPIQKINCLSK